MLKDLVALLDPVFIRVEGWFTPRGGIAFQPVGEWTHQSFPDMDVQSVYQALGVEGFGGGGPRQL